MRDMNVLEADLKAGQGQSGDRTAHPLAARLLAVLTFGGLCAVSSASVAAEEGVTAQGSRYISGGVSAEEQAALHMQRKQFSLWVVTAARGSGAYLAKARVKVTDPQRNTVFDGELDGPWLLIDLPAGRYRVEAQVDGQLQQRVTTIQPGDHHQAVLYFDVDADVLPSAAGGRSGESVNPAQRGQR